MFVLAGISTPKPETVKSPEAPTFAQPTNESNRAEENAIGIAPLVETELLTVTVRPSSKKEPVDDALPRADSLTPPPKAMTAGLVKLPPRKTRLSA